MSEWWRYENLDPVAPDAGWELGTKQTFKDDFTEFHLDLGCGKIPKARLGIDRNQGDIQMNLDTGEIVGRNRNLDDFGEYFLFGFKEGWVLPFPKNSIKSIVSHHFFEHLSSDGFINLIDDCYRVLEPGGILRIIVPVFPSRSAWESSDHKMWIGRETFTDFTGNENQEHWHESFATPYTKARFTQTAMDITPAPQITAKVKDVDSVVFFVDGEEVGYSVDTDLIFNKPRELRVTLTK